MDLILSNIEGYTLSLQTFEFAPYLLKHWTSHRILRNIGILTLSLETLDYRPYPFKFGVRTLSFQTLEVPLYRSNSDLIVKNIGIATLSLETLKF